MTTAIRTCAVCEQRFVVAAAHRLTCSAACRLELAARRARHRNLIAWSLPPMPSAPVGPHRVRDALVETRAAVEALLAEGRRRAKTPNEPLPFNTTGDTT